MTTDHTGRTGQTGDEQEPPSVDDMRHARRTARGYLPPLDDDQAAALDARPIAEKSVEDFRHSRRRNRI